LHDIEWRSEVASAQIKSAVLLAALVAGVRAKVTEPARSRDHTERMLQARGASIHANGTGVVIDAASPLAALDTAVPGDPSSAAFFAGLGALADGGELRLEHVCVNETRTGLMASSEWGDPPRRKCRLEGGVGRRRRCLAKQSAARPSPTPTCRRHRRVAAAAVCAARADGETVITGAVSFG
jgi:3-phosphoshikimate 1-carboxyvinyltransferase